LLIGAGGGFWASKHFPDIIKFGKKADADSTQTVKESTPPTTEEAATQIDTTKNEEVNEAVIDKAKKELEGRDKKDSNTTRNTSETGEEVKETPSLTLTPNGITPAEPKDDNSITPAEPIKNEQEGATLFDPIHGERYMLHLVKQRETLFSIADHYHIKQEKIQNLNDMGNNTKIIAGQQIKIPVPNSQRNE
jgi:LysM repeat protein